MKLHLRLSLPFLAVAVAVSVLGGAGAVWIANRTLDAMLAQEGRQLGRIGENALLQEGRTVVDAAAVMAFVDGSVARRIAAWRKVPLDAAGIVRQDTGAVVSWTGDAIEPADLAGLRFAPAGTPVMVRSRTGLMVAGFAGDSGGYRIVVAARRLDHRFAAELASLLQAGITLDVAGKPVASAGTGIPDTVPVLHRMATPGGTVVGLTMSLPGTEVRSARRRATAATLAGGLTLLGAGIAFYLYLLSRVTRPLSELIDATDRIAAGAPVAGLPVHAPGEIGDLARRFASMNASLREAQDRLIRSAKLSSVGALVAGVSHEVNNPLSVLLAHAEHQATLVPPGAPGREELDVMLEQGHRMRKILTELRGLVRPGSDLPGPVDLNAVARESLSLVRHDAAKAGVECEAILAPGEIVVTSSPDDLRQIALNLAVNALQAMPSGGRLVFHTGRSEVNGRKLAHISVRDTGHGIPAEDLPRVGEPFFSTKPGRLGLGLAICGDLAKRHGGTLEIDSAPGRGTLVTLEFPA